MSILKGPGILLNPLTIAQPVYLPSLFDRALASSGTNLCAVNDELGAIAHALHEHNATDEANQLFDILESEYTLSQQREDILKCIQCATPQILTHALFRSGRYLKEHERPRPKRGTQREVSDIDIVAALCKHGTQIAAAKALGSIQSNISIRITQAAEDSALGVFKGTFKAAQPLKASDEEIAAALTEHGTQTAAAVTLGVSRGTIFRRIAEAAEDSALYVFKGTFKRGIAQKVSDDEIAAALTKHGTQAAAAKALGVSTGTISARIAQATEDSALYAFKGTFNRGWSKRKKSDDEIAETLTKHDTQAAAAKALGISKWAVSTRIAQATEGSALYVFKGAFKEGRPKKASDDEIAAALTEHGTRAAAAKALDVSPRTISKRVVRSTEDSALYAFKGTFKRGRRKRHQ